MEKPIVCVAAEDKIIRHTVRSALVKHGFDVVAARERVGFLRALENQCPDLVVIGGCENSTWDGLKAAKDIRRWGSKIPIIMVYQENSRIPTSAFARIGISHSLTLPVSCEELISSVVRNLFGHQPELCSQNHKKASAPIAVHFNNGYRMVGESHALREVKNLLLKVAAADSTVLITGETGTGKELAAEMIQRNSPRRENPFISINCAALPDTLLESELFGYERGAFTGAVSAKQGSFEQANGGTLFLDEIGDMSPYAQAKILRVIENKEVHHLGGKRKVPLDVRIITATNKDPEQLVAEKKFRKDLYFRLNVARVHLPPLRKRKEDILFLLDHYIEEFNLRFQRKVEGFTDEALTLLFAYEWTGNIRELKNLVEASFINLPARKVSLMDLPEPFRRQVCETQNLPRNERDRLLLALFTTNWNKSKAAQKLHWSRMTLYRKLAKYNIVSGGTWPGLED
jgi:DNA-binding NtrC family response regulator